MINRILILLGLVLVFSSDIQAKSAENYILQGRVLLQSSGNSPVKGVEISGRIINIDKEFQKVVSDAMGYFEIEFSGFHDPEALGIELKVGPIDGMGNKIGVLNGKDLQFLKELEYDDIPIDNDIIFEIIVYKQSVMDKSVQSYFSLIDESSNSAITKIEKEYAIRDDRPGRFVKSQIETQRDSQLILNHSRKIAFINKDKASESVLRYLNLLDSGTPLEKARAALNIKEATRELDQSVQEWVKGNKDSYSVYTQALGPLAKKVFIRLDELALRLYASKAILDYPNAKICCDSIISQSKKFRNHFIFDIGAYYKEAVLVNKLIGFSSVALDYSYENLNRLIDGFGIPLHVEEHDEDLELVAAIITHADLMILFGIDDNEDYFDPSESLSEAYSILKELENQNDASIGVLYAQIAHVAAQEELYKFSIQAIDECLNNFKSNLPPNHPSYQKSEEFLLSLKWGKATNHGANGEFLEALKDLNYINQRVDALDVLNYTADVHSMLSDYPSAIEVLQKTLSIPSDLPDQYAKLGAAYFGNNQQQKAREAFETAVEIHKSNQDLINEYGKVYEGVEYVIWAKYYAVIGDKEKALSNLKIADDHGSPVLNLIPQNGLIFESLNDYNPFNLFFKKLELEKE